MNNEDFREWGHRMVDWLYEYMSNIKEYSVSAQVEPGEIRSKLLAEPPEIGEDMEAIFKDFKDIIMPGVTHWQHPNWYAYFPANNSPPSVLAELLTAGLGAQCMVWKTTPSGTELEEVVMDWLKQMLGLPEDWSGVIQGTASTSSLVGLLTAREWKTDFRSNLDGIKDKMTIYVSEESHSSVEKGAKIAGFGKNNIRKIPTDDTFSMIPGELEKAVEKDIENGFVPTCTAATLGTTSSCGVDSLDKIGPICKKYKLWLHVDAAYAGSAAILPELRWILKGIEYVDSFVFNPHKWLLINFDCSAYFVKDEGLLIRTFEIFPEYLKTGVDSEVKNFRDWGIPLGRRFRALKLWFVIRSYGVNGLRKMVSEHIQMAQWMKDQIEGHPKLELMAPVYFGLVCFRLNPGNMDEEKLNDLNAEFLDRINKSGKVFLTHTTLKGKYVVRMSIGSRTTGWEEVKGAWVHISDTTDVLGSK